MRRLLVYFFAVVIISFAIAICFYANLGVFRLKQKNLNELNYCMDSSDYNDVIYIGTSRVKHHINPVLIDSITGIKSYAVSIAGSGIVESNLLLNEYIKHHPKPKTVFIGIDDNNFDTRGILFNITDYFYYLNDTLVYRLLSPYKLAYRYKPAQYFYSMQKIFALPDVVRKNIISPPPSSNGKPDAYLRGFVPMSGKWGADAEKELTTVKSNIKYQQTGFDLLKTMVDECRHDSINIIFLFTPVYYEIGSKYLNEEIIITKVKDVAAKCQVPVWDYRGMPICKSKDYFYNFLHLNEKGAVIFSRQFALDIWEKLYNKPVLDAKGKKVK